MNRTSFHAILPSEREGRGGGLAVLAVIALLAVLGVLALPAHAADDSNAGTLTPAPSVSPQQLNSALSALSQGNNDTQLQRLLSQFQSELASGNTTGAASTLVQLQNLPSGQGVDSQALSALLRSLSVGSGGASVNTNTLSSLLNETSNPNYDSGQSAQKLSVDMQTLANLIQYTNSTLASQFLQGSDTLSKSAYSGQLPAGGVPVSLPGVGGFSGLTVPSVGAPSVGVGAPSGTLPSVPLVAFVVPLVLVAAAAALYYSRRRLVRLIGSPGLPRITLPWRAPEAAGEDTVETSTDPRRRIELYFRRATGLMARRGVPKLDSETHREFYAKCEGKAERPHLGTISSLYEKAKFSGQPVGAPEADLAASELSAMGRDKR